MEQHTGKQHLYLLRYILVHRVKKDNHLIISRMHTSSCRASHALPVIYLNPARTSLFDFRSSDFELEGYDPHPDIRALRRYN